MIERALQFLPPEIAHRATIAALRAGFGPTAPPRPPVCNLFRRTLSSRIGLAGGADKNAEALAGWQRIGFGFVEAGTVTPDRRAGNSRPRVWRVGRSGLINWMGLPNLGLKAFRENLVRFRESEVGERFCVGASVFSPSGDPDELWSMVRTLTPYVDFFTKNASCPNTVDQAEASLAGHAAETRAMVGAVKPWPVLIKLAPTLDETSLRSTIEVLLDAGASGFVACNTIPADSTLLKSGPPHTWPQRDGAHVGGYSGPSLLEISTWMVSQIRARAPSATIIGCGGVQSGDDLRRMLDAGADAVEIYTGLARHGTKLLRDLLAAELQRHEPRTVA